MTLPYDYARCNGASQPQCSDCLRRTSLGRPEGWQTYDEPYWFYNPFTGQRKWIAEPLNDASHQNLPWRGLTAPCRAA